MAIMLPPALQPITDMSGAYFPYVNEDIMHAHGAAVRVVNAGTDTATNQADTAVRNTTAAYQGEGATQLQNYWQETGNQTGHLSQITTASNIAPIALDGIANVATGAKAVAISVLAAGTVRLAYSTLLGPGAAASTIQTLLATRNASMKIVRELSEGIEKRLGPSMVQRIKGPLDRAAERLRPPGAPGSPALAGAGHAHFPTPKAGNAFDENPGILQRGGRGGRGGGRGRTEANQDLTEEEQAALDAKNAGEPYDRGLFNRASKKADKEEKFQGDRNAQKRGRRRK